MIETILIYNMILLLSVASAVGVKVSRGWSEWAMRGLLFLIMTLPAAIRYGIGTDYPSYAAIYHASATPVDYVEIGYAVINTLLYHLGANVQWLFALLAIITYAPIAFGVRRNWIVPVVLFYMLTIYLSSYSLVRQSIAVAWILVAVTRYMDDEHIGKLYLWIVMASLIHLSALLILPFILLRRVHISAWLILFALPIAYYAATHGLIDSLFGSEMFLDSKYGVYATNEFNRKTTMGSGLGIALKMLIPIVYIVLARKAEHRYDTILYLSAAYIVAIILSMQIHIFNRLVDIFSLAPILALAVMSTKMRKTLLTIILGILLLINFQRTITANPSNKNSGLGISPYVTVLEQR